MKERPILFSAPMVSAILAGTKTQTRRVVKPQPIFSGAGGDSFEWHGGKALLRAGYGAPYVHTNTEAMVRAMLQCCPYGVPGDELWVRETWRWDSPDDPERALFAATPPAKLPPGFKWKPSIHMPRAASRIQLRVTFVRVERLQELNAADAIAEGLKKVSKDDGRTWKYGIPDRDGQPGNDDDGWPWVKWDVDPVAAYRKLWDQINVARAPWSSNPWVWVISFERIKP